MRLFRKLRVIFSELNPLRNRLISATGEILLIVVGILLALFVDDLRDEHSENQHREYYQNAILNDLVRDSISIGRTSEVIGDQLAIIDNQIARIFDSNATMDTLIHIARVEFDYRWQTTKYHDNSFQALVSTGNIELIDKKIVHLLMDLDNAHKKEIQWSQDNGRSYQYKIDAFLETYSFNYKDLPDDNLIDSILWSNIDERDFAGKFRALIFMKKFREMNTLIFLEETANMTNALIDRVRTGA